jgi:hypothetical protein
MFICLEGDQYGVNVNRSRLTPLEVNRDFLYTGPDKVNLFGINYQNTFCEFRLFTQLNYLSLGKRDNGKARLYQYIGF